jgi:MraZ protein
MRQFVGNQTKEIDAKKRLMIPAAFRNALREGDGFALILRPSPSNPCIEGWPPETLAALIPKAEAIDPFDDAAALKAASLFGTGEAPKIDAEGRMVLPEEMAAHAGIKDSAMFIGLGNRFMIWEPAAGRAWLAKASGKP